MIQGQAPQLPFRCRLESSTLVACRYKAIIQRRCHRRRKPRAIACHSIPSLAEGREGALGAPCHVLVFRQLFHRQEQVVGLGKNRILEDGLIGDEGVLGGHAADGGIKFVKQLVRDAGGDFGSIAPAQ